MVSKMSNKSILVRPLLIFSRSFSSSFNTHSQNCNDFLPWLEHKAGREISSVLSIGKSPIGRSLFATKFVQPGDCLLKVPYDVQIRPENIIPEISSLLPDEVGNVARLALVILAEQRKGQHSEWAPYVGRLPEVGEMHETIFWSKIELEMIRQSSVYQETIKKNARIKKCFSAIRPVLCRFPETSVRVTFECFRHAYAVGLVRRYLGVHNLKQTDYTKSIRRKNEANILTIDFVNHDGCSETLVLSDEAKKLSEVIADCVYVPGDQVFISYGKFSNATLLLDFGFTLSLNIYDEVKIQLDVPDGDPLRNEKLDLLKTHHTPAIEEDNTSFCSPLNVFTIKEVRSVEGKGRGIPQALRAYCRVLCSTSSQELKDMAIEAMNGDGRLARYPMKNKRRELEAHHFLLSWIDQLVERYNFSIKLLELSSSPCVIEQCNRRRKMALDLLTGELRVLRSATEWLKNYCAKLQEC